MTSSYLYEPELPLAKLEDPVPMHFGRAGARSLPAYEWFYLEARLDHLKAVLILFSRDAFLGGKTRDLPDAPAAAYLTLFDRSQLEAYSYTQYAGADAAAFRAALDDWLTGTAASLELSLPCHSASVLWQLSLSLQGVRPARSEVDACAEGRPAAHLWQLLGPALRADLVLRRESCALPSRSLPLSRPLSPRRGSRFYDVPLALRLSRRAPRDHVLAGATCYFDHNVGWEPLDRVRQPWTWWQRHGKPGEAWEVGYWFPRAGKGYFGTSGDGFRCVRVADGGFQFRESLTIFGVRAPVELVSFSGARFLFSRRLESAPFYVRAECPRSHATVESLIPARLATRACQSALAARRMRFGESPPAGSGPDFGELNRLVTERNGRSFALASKILGRGDRARARFVYLLCRLVDDATDESPEQRGGAQASAEWLEAVFGPEPGAEAIRKIAPFLANRLSAASGRAVTLSGASAYLAAARRTAACMALERAPFDELVRGQRMDESFSRPRDFDELYLYCYRVAGVVGLMMAAVFRARRTAAALEAAEHLGIAMQLTNICRDVREDHERGRNYFPHADKADPAFPTPAEVLRLGIAGVRYYHSALGGLDAIPGFRARLCVRLMAAIYGSILGTILANPALPAVRRVVVPTSRRLWIFLQVFLGRSPLAAAGLTRWLPVATQRHARVEFPAPT